MTVREHEIDAILTRRIEADDAFRRAFVAAVSAQVGLAREVATAAAATQRPHVGASGTIDVIASFADSAGKEALALLIEDKIDARFTPNQPERYVASAAAMSKLARPAFAVLCAPGGYIAASRLARRFHARLPLETIADWLDGADQIRVRQAIDQFEMPVEADPVPEVAEFFEGYRQLVAAYAPELIVKASPNSDGGRPKGSYTVYFDTKRTLPRCPFLPTLRFSHQCQDKDHRPSVKVMFARWTVAARRVQAVAEADLRGTPYYVRPAGESLAVVCDTPWMDNQLPVRQQMEAVMQGIRAAATLRAWMFGNEDALRRWAAAAESETAK